MTGPAVQRVCPVCRGLTVAAHPHCAYCGRRFQSEMMWKVPFIIALFLASFLAAVLLYGP